jgi:hypothetical protein
MKKWLFVFITSVLIACNPKVINFVNDTASFADYHTYDVVNYKAQGSDISDEGSTLFTFIEREIANQMNRRSYALSTKAPDILIRYEIISNQVTQTNTSTAASPYGYYSTPVYTTRTSLEAALLLEMTDLKTKKMIWQASVDMSQYDKKSTQSEVIKKSMQALFNTYLYRAGSSDPDDSLKEDI